MTGASCYSLHHLTQRQIASRTGSAKLHATVSTHLLSQTLDINLVHSLLHRLKANNLSTAARSTICHRVERIIVHMGPNIRAKTVIYKEI